MRILLLDADASYRHATADTLFSHGYLVDSCETVNEALDALQESQYVAAIIEAFMNERFFDEYRDISPELPIIVVTGHPSWRNAVMSMRNGAVQYLSKEDGDFKEQLIEALASSIVNFEAAGFEINMRDQTIFYQGKEIELPDLQFRLFAHMLRHRFRRVRYDELGVVAGLDDPSVSDGRRRLAATMHNLRKRLEAQTGYEVISSRPYVGFLLEEVQLS